jgi:hypothetical protein
LDSAGQQDTPPEFISGQAGQGRKSVAIADDEDTQVSSICAAQSAYELKAIAVAVTRVDE